MLTLAEVEADIKAGFGKITHLLYAPQTAHPVLEDARKFIVAEIQSHMSGVMTLATTMGSNILKQLEASLTNPANAPAAVVANAPPK